MEKRRFAWLMLLALTALPGIGCDKKKEETKDEKKADDDDGVDEAKSSKKKKKKKGDDDEEKKAKLPDGYDDKVDAKALAKAAKWARKSPKKVSAISGLRMPGGGEEKSMPLGEATFYTQQYEDVSLQQAELGWMVLLADDGFTIAELKRTNDRPMFAIKKDGSTWSALVGAPAGKEDTGANLTVVYGKDGAGRVSNGDKGDDAAKPKTEKAAVAAWKVGDKCQVLWNGSYYAAKVIGVNGASYKITYDGYDSSWDEWVGTGRMK